MTDWWGQPVGRVKDGEFEGWHYRVQFDHHIRPIETDDGSMLVLVWPSSVELRPLPARLVYIKPESL